MAKGSPFVLHFGAPSQAWVSIRGMGWFLTVQRDLVFDLPYSVEVSYQIISGFLFGPSGTALEAGFWSTNISGCTSNAVQDAG